MKAGIRVPGSAAQRGFSLVELMISMTLGLILLIALAYFFLGSRQLNRTHDDVSRMQESGRHALETLGRAIRQAGYRSDAELTFAQIHGGQVALTGIDGAPDSITVRHTAQEGGETDCTGANVAAGGLVTHAFVVNANRELTCNGSVVADNIEDLQLEYGIDMNRDGIIGNEANETYTATPSASQFLQAAAVRVTVTVRGPSPNAATGGDGFLRQVYTATFAVRNQAG